MNDRDVPTEGPMARCRPDAGMIDFVALFVPRDVLELPANGAFQCLPSLFRATAGPPAA